MEETFYTCINCFEESTGEEWAEATKKNLDEEYHKNWNMENAKPCDIVVCPCCNAEIERDELDENTDEEEDD